MTNNDIKHIEATKLNSYLDTLSYWERVEFVTCVTKLAGVRRQTFFNWKGMACRIPEHAKQIIEDEAGKRIFDDTDPDTERPQP
jgi:hypothetical protein